MLAVKSANVRDNFKEWCEKISMGETKDTIMINRNLLYYYRFKSSIYLYLS